jgi:hypothetical protein
MDFTLEIYATKDHHGNQPSAASFGSISAQISDMVAADGVDASGEVKICRNRRACWSRGNSFQAAISASLGVAEGMTALSVRVVITDAT